MFLSVSKTATTLIRFALRYAFAIVLLLAGAQSAHAVVFTLGGGPNPENAGVDMDSTSALYARSQSGRVVLIAQLGGLAPDGASFSDLGIPSISPDGSVVFGAETRGQDDVPRWNIYRADPDRPPVDRLSFAFSGAEMNSGCKPVFKIDPLPVAGPKGAVGFVAGEESGRDSVFLYDGARFNCVAHVGDRTAQGHYLRIISFGSLDIAADGEIAFLAHLSTSAKLRRDRAAILLTSIGSPIRELAVEGQKISGGSALSGKFGRPAIAHSQFGPIVAFASDTRRGAALYLSSAGHLSESIHIGERTPIGKLTYLSNGRPGVNADGTVVVRAACRSTYAVFRMKDGEISIVAREGDRTNSGARIASFADPWAASSGKIFLDGYDDSGRSSVFIFDAADQQVTPGSARRATSRSGDMSQAFPGTAAFNQRGDFAFLGAPQAARAIKTGAYLHQ